MLRIPADRPALASFPSRGGTTATRLSLPRAPGAFASAGQGCWPASLTGSLTWSRLGLPGSWWTFVACPALWPRRERRACPVSFDAPLLPSASLTASAPAALMLSRLNHTAYSLAIYASQPGLPLHHARLASGWGLAFPGRARPPV